MPRYVATLRATFDAEDDVRAAMMSEVMRENASSDLDDDDNAEIMVTQVTSNALDLSPEETIVLFRRARNALVKTRIKQCYDMAREFDKMIWTLEHRQEEDFSLSNYDYTKFMEVCEEVIDNNRSPITY